MGYPTYYVIEDDTLPILFDTFDGGTGASITMTGLATTDIEIYKDGSNTTRASDNGYALLGTDGIDEFGTGVHGFSIDLSDNSDAGFYAVGSWYHVVVASVTVDAQTVTFIAAAFRILDATRGMTGTALPDVVAGANAGSVNDVMMVSGDATAADNLEEGATGLVLSSVNDASASTTAFVTALTEATDDHYVGRALVFTDGAMLGQATNITAYNGTSKQVTVAELTEAPPNSATFIIT